MQPSATNLFLSYCSVSPIHPVGLQALNEFNSAQAETGVLVFEKFAEYDARFRSAFARMLGVQPDDIAFTPSTSAAMNQIAQSYPFSWRDRILTYEREFPSNYFPWVAAQRYRKVGLDVLPDSDPLGTLPPGPARGWSFADLERIVSKRTRLIAISHVQYTSGFAADLERLGEFCHKRKIDLIIDAAQSLGCLQLQPERYGIAAIAASGWKFLLAPHGAGVLYTSRAFREKLNYSSAGPMMMKQGVDYGNLTWNPVSSGRRFEPTTSPASLLTSLGAIVDSVFTPEAMPTIESTILHLNTLMVSKLNSTLYTPVQFEERNRSGILSVRCKRPTHEVVTAARAQGLILTERGGYLRIAPHSSTTEDDICRAATVLNRIS